MNIRFMSGCGGHGPPCPYLANMTVGSPPRALLPVRSHLADAVEGHHAPLEGVLRVFAVDRHNIDGVRRVLECMRALRRHVERSVAQLEDDCVAEAGVELDVRE